MQASFPSSPAEQSHWDRDTDPNFLAYYEQNHDSPAARQRFLPVLERVIEVRRREGLSTRNLDVLDVGCGPGAQCLLWAEHGHRVSGIDISADFVNLARTRLARAGFEARFENGSATALPFESGSRDVVLVPELLEHVADWQSVLAEAYRVLRPNGVVYLSTTNVVCPRQMEFELPLYSWYPGFVKRHVEKLSVTTHPHLANHAKYPAVNWFSYGSLSRHLRGQGYKCYTRFDLFRAEGHGALVDGLLGVAQSTGLLGMAGRLLTASTVLYGVKLPRGNR